VIMIMAVIVIVITSKFPTVMGGSELMYSYSADGIAAVIFCHAIKFCYLGDMLSRRRC